MTILNSKVTILLYDYYKKILQSYNDDTVIEDEEEYLNSSQFSANESDDNEIEFTNSNEAPVDPTSVFPPETEPYPYEIARNNNIAELGAAIAQAQANGEF